MIFNALSEILFWEDMPVLKRFIEENTRKYYPHDSEGYYREKDRFLSEMIPDRAEFIRRLEVYADRGGPVWVSGKNGHIDEITEENIHKALRVHGKRERAKETAEKVEKMIAAAPKRWAVYTNAALWTDENCILELTVGAGGGTAAIMRQMKEKDLFIGVDIDFKCAKNADSLAEYYGVSGAGIAASLWNLPFENEIFTSVTCRRGLEECREVPTIINEAGRVLKSGGRAVFACSIWEKSQSHPYFEKYGFTYDETVAWLKRLRLHSGIEGLIELAKTAGLKLSDRHDFQNSGTVVVFEKTAI